MIYTSFADWKDAPNATQYYLNENPALTGYHCAPQVFFFAPQNKWYLVFQSGQPQYSTNDDIARPEAWTKPVNFFATEPATVKANKGSGGWLDFWVICDQARCHLFFTDDNGELFRSQTKVEDFPNGFEEPVIAIQGTKETLFEGSASYRVEETNGYLTMVEGFGPSGQRFYQSFVSDALDGEWTEAQATWENPFAGLNNVSFASGVTWSQQVSHGELIRSGYDQTLSISLRDLRFLYQGVDPKKGNPEYFRLPYRLALLTRSALP
ncbi:MAG: non-reducing end alpha-L-arabinofuranosidase family hydrolase [Polyangiaceae bacterium]